MASTTQKNGTENSAPFKIEKVQSWRATLRRATAWKTARYTKGDIEATVVGISDHHGNTGYGYMPAMLIVGESPATAEALLHTTIAPLLGQDPVDGVQPVMRAIDLAIGGNVQLKFAVEEALLDLYAKRMQTPLFNLFGGVSRREVPVMRMLGLKPPKETADEALALAERGYRYVKIKIGLDDKRDIETVKRTRDALGEDVFISVDANQAYTPMRAVKILNQLSDCNLVVCRATGQARRRARHEVCAKECEYSDHGRRRREHRGRCAALDRSRRHGRGQHQDLENGRLLQIPRDRIGV